MAWVTTARCGNEVAEVQLAMKEASSRIKRSGAPKLQLPKSEFVVQVTQYG